MPCSTNPLVIIVDQFEQNGNRCKGILPAKTGGGTAANKRRHVGAGKSDERIDVPIVFEVAKDLRDAAAHVFARVPKERQGERRRLVATCPDQELATIEAQTLVGIGSASFSALQNRLIEDFTPQFVPSGFVAGMPAHEMKLVEQTKQRRITALLRRVRQETQIIDHSLAFRKSRGQGTGASATRNPWSALWNFASYPWLWFTAQSRASEL